MHSRRGGWWVDVSSPTALKEAQDRGNMAIVWVVVIFAVVMVIWGLVRSDAFESYVHLINQRLEQADRATTDAFIVRSTWPSRE